MARKTTVRPTPTVRTAKHLGDYDAKVPASASAAKRQSLTADAKQCNVAHYVGHLREDPALRPKGLVTVGEDEFDHTKAMAMTARRKLDELVTAHHAAHHDTCAECAAEIVSAHTDSSCQPTWFHVKGGTVACAGVFGQARPSRWPVCYATITMSMRVRLPGALGADVDAEDAAHHFEKHFVSYMIDDQEEQFRTDPLDITDTVIVASDVSDRRRVATDRAAVEASVTTNS